MSRERLQRAERGRTRFASVAVLEAAPKQLRSRIRTTGTSLHGDEEDDHD